MFLDSQICCQQKHILAIKAQQSFELSLILDCVFFPSYSLFCLPETLALVLHSREVADLEKRNIYVDT